MDGFHSIRQTASLLRPALGNNRDGKPAHRRTKLSILSRSCLGHALSRATNSRSAFRKTKAQHRRLSQDPIGRLFHWQRQFCADGSKDFEVSTGGDGVRTKRRKAVSTDL